MGKIEVILVNPWWHDPLLIALFSSILTGLIFALVLYFYSRLMEKRDILVSLTSELTTNYKSIKKMQCMVIGDLDKNDGMIASLRKEMPWNKDLTDEKIFLDFIKNQPMDQQLSIDCWIKLQSQVAKYSKDYTKYEEIYGILKRIIRFSKIKSGDISNINDAEKAVVNQSGAIRINSKDFIEKYEKVFKIKKPVT